MPHLFLDTSYLVALTNVRDKFHQLAIKKFEELENSDSISLSTSDYVIDELLNITMKHYGFDKALRWGKILFEQSFTKIIYTNEKILNSAWTLFQAENHERKPMNLTDCVVAVCSSMLRCDEILTYDERLKNFK